MNCLLVDRLLLSRNKKQFYLSLVSSKYSKYQLKVVNLLSTASNPKVVQTCHLATWHRLMTSTFLLLHRCAILGMTIRRKFRCASLSTHHSTALRLRVQGWLKFKQKVGAHTDQNSFYKKTKISEGASRFSKQNILDHFSPSK